MPTIAVIKESLRQWVEYAISDTDAANRTIFAQQGSPRPELPYLSISIDTITAVGRDAVGETDDRGERDVVGNRLMSVTVQAYGSDAVGLAEAARSYLWAQDVLDIFNNDGLAFVDATAVQNIAEVIGAEFEERATFSPRFAFASTITEDVGYFDSVTSTGTLIDLDDSEVSI